VATYLLTVQSTQAIGDELKVLPKVPIGTLVAREPDLKALMPGDPLELRLPSGDIRAAAVASFGVETWERDGNLYFVGDPDNPELTLVIAGGLQPDDVPAGTEIWTTAPQTHTTTDTA
jgi:hypothetical protein